MEITFFKNQDVIGKRLYYCDFVYSIILTFLLASNYVPLISEKGIHRFLYLAVAVLIFKIYVLDKYDLREFICKSIVLLLAVISWRLVRNIDILLYVSFILGAKNVNFRGIVKLFLGTVGILLAGTVLISQASIVKDFVYVRDHFHRHSLGIGYPTDTAAYVFYLLLAYYYLKFRRITWRTYLVVFFLDLLVYKFTQARNSFILILLTIPVIWIAQRAYQGKKISRGVASFYWMIIPLTAYCTLLLSWLYKGSSRIFGILNRALSGRLSLSHQALQKYGISILGQHITENGWGGSKGLKNFYKPGASYFYIDSSYIRLAVIYGILLGILIIILMTIIAYRSTLHREFILAAIIMLISLHSIVEQHLIDFSYNPFLFAFIAMSTINNKKTIHKDGGKQSDE